MPACFVRRSPVSNPGIGDGRSDLSSDPLTSDY
jgi:hypothetical protein